MIFGVRLAALWAAESLKAVTVFPESLAFDVACLANHVLTIQQSVAVVNGEIKTRHLWRVGMNGWGRLFRFLAGDNCIFPLPLDPRLAEPESIVDLYGVHAVRDVMVDKGLNFADKGAMSAHLFSRHEPGLLHDAAMMDDGVEVVVKGGETLVGLQLTFKMVDSQFAPLMCELVRAAFDLNHRMRPASLLVQGAESAIYRL
jgi:hypothetical protein